MNAECKILLAAAIYTAMPWLAARAQAPPPTIIQIDTENLVRYVEDVSDPSKFATLPGPVATGPQNNFTATIQFGDIVAVNGQPAKGTYSFYSRTFFLTPTPNPGNAIADAVRTAFKVQYFEILKPDGTPIGTIMMDGLTGGTATPGAPLAGTGGNVAIVGGTGAFLGVRGEVTDTPLPVPNPTRVASIVEDPSNRRKNGGGATRNLLHLIPMSWPQIVSTPSGPAISHSKDFSPVTSSKPAATGEILSLVTTGLGPTRPGVDPGQPFPSSPLAVVNSPVAVFVNGKSAQVLAAVGYPGAVDAYQVNFQVPPDATPGPATVQVTAAWIAGPTVNISIQ
jgi:uncharacterized protein (TIGR03437 family)